MKYNRDMMETSTLKHNIGMEKVSRCNIYRKDLCLLGTYNYRNPYFKYVGDWAQNKKHGQGRLELGDGSYYEV